MTAALSALLAAASVLAWGSGRGDLARARLLALPQAPGSAGARAGSDGSGPAASRVGPARPALVVAAVAVVTGIEAVADGAVDPALAAAALAVGGAVWWFPGRRAAVVARRETAEVVAALPTAADLLATCLSAGAAPAEALRTVAESTTGVLGVRLRRVAAGLELGATQAEAWGPITVGDPLAPLARALIRSASTGAPVAQTVADAADESRRAQRWLAEAAARRAGVLAVGPLGVCFLPAFILIGVVPVVLAVATEMLGGLR